MSSAVDICNLALSHLGDEAEVIAIVPPDGTIQAAHCGRFYPMARDVLLEMHPWTFATARASLAVQPDAPPSEWAYAYALPNNCLKPRAIYMPAAAQDGRGEDYIVETDADGDGVVYTNVAEAVMRFTYRQADTTKFTPGFVTALSRLLAAYLAGPIIKGSTGIQASQSQLKWFGVEFANARASDANTGQRSTYSRRIPDVVRARESSGLGGFAVDANGTIFYP